MKRVFSFCLLCVFAVTAAIACCACYSTERSAVDGVTYLRIHIRANSNSAQDQAVKYDVRDAVVAGLTPSLKEATTFERALTEVNARLDDIVRTAEYVLHDSGYSYGARASVREENFPTRAYGELVLPAGKYRALIVELGSGAGDNWWCVAYPPLCFGTKEEIIVKSKFLEIIQSWF